jgi:hypothetical protein
MHKAKTFHQFVVISGQGTFQEYNQKFIHAIDDQGKLYPIGVYPERDKD